MAKSIADQLKSLEKTAWFKKQVNTAYKNNVGSVKGAATQAASFYADEMRQILRDEIADIKSQTTGESFLDHILVNESVTTIEKNGTVYVCISLQFDEVMMRRQSLVSEETVNIAKIFNQGYEAEYSVFGYDRHGQFINSLTQREGLHFVENAISKFNNRYRKNIAYAEFNRDWINP